MELRNPEASADRTESHAAKLVDLVMSLTADKIPQRAMGQAKACLLNSIACGLYGVQQQWGKIIAQNTLAESGPGECTVLGMPNTIAPAPAALINGTSIHGFEVDDVLPGTFVHAGTVIVPAVLAAAEQVNASGLELLRSVVIGYEVMVRISRSLGDEPAKRGFHMTPVVGPVGAAIAAGIIFGLSKSQMLDAIGLACSSSSGLKSFAGGSGAGMVKRMHAGQSAATGVRMCQLAALGFTAPPAALDGKFSLIDVFGGATGNPARLTEAFGERWALDNVWVKVYPMCSSIHSTAQVLENLRGDQKFQPDEVDEVRVGTTKYAVQYNCDPAPDDIMGAQYSIPYCAAVALTGDAKDPSYFTDRAIADPAVKALASRVHLHVDAEADAAHPAKNPARVELRLKNGEVRTGMVFEAHGTAADPCSEKEHAEIFHRLASAALSDAAIDRVLTVSERLERASVRELSAALRS